MALNSEYFIWRSHFLSSPPAPIRITWTHLFLKFCFCNCHLLYGKDNIKARHGHIQNTIDTIFEVSD